MHVCLYFNIPGALETEDKAFWYSLDKHLPDAEFANKVRDKRGYVLLEDGKPMGV